MLRVIVMVSMLLAVPAAPAAVYKWVDEDGRVHFGDRPVGEDAARVPIRSGPGSTAPEAPGIDRQDRQQRLIDSMESRRLERAEARRTDRAEREERARRCALARDRLRRYDNAGFLYDLDRSGERRVLEGAERQRATDRARQAVDRWCG